MENIKTIVSGSFKSITLVSGAELGTNFGGQDSGIRRKKK